MPVAPYVRGSVKKRNVKVKETWPGHDKQIEDVTMGSCWVGRNQIGGAGPGHKFTTQIRWESQLVCVLSEHQA